LACGILPIAVGKATRLFDYSLNKTKRYTVVFDFGYTTDTLDITGEKTHEGYVPTKTEIALVINKLIGEIDQVPPIYSAKNVDGCRAYDLARKGIQFELKPKKITVFKFELIKQVSDNQFMFDIVCSSGTYIRAIGRDLAKLLDTYACMSFLERTETGTFNLATAVQLEHLLKSDTNIQNYLLSPIESFLNFDVINIDNQTFEDLLNGKRPKYKLLSNDTFVVYNSKLVGVAKKNHTELILDTFLYENEEE